MILWTSFFSDTWISRKYAYKGVDFDVQNVLRLSYEHLYFQKIFHWTPLNEGGEELREGDGMEWQGREGSVGEKGREGEERGWEGNWNGKGAEAPLFRIYGYDTAESYSLSAVLLFFLFGVTQFVLHYILALAWSCKTSFGSI